MNRVGQEGRGESVWLGWFLHANLSEFAGIADRRQEEKRAAAWRNTAASLATALDKEAWDGEWYKRAFFDDGTPLGSAQNDECQIDSIAQSWAVLSGAGDAERARQAMDSVDAPARPSEGPANAAALPAVRRDAARSGIHQGIPARHSGKRRAVHPRRGLVGHGVCSAWRGRQELRPLQPAEPDSPRESSCELFPLQGGALRRRRGCLLRTRPRGTRRVDVVHWGRRLGSTGRAWSRSSDSTSAARPSASIHAYLENGNASRSSTVTARRSIGSRSRIRTQCVEEYPASVSTEPSFRQTRPSRCPTTASNTWSRSCSDRRSRTRRQREG